VLYVAEVDGLPAAKALIDRLGLANDHRFLACVRGLVRALPRTRLKDKWVVPEAGVLDSLVTAYFPGIHVPDEDDWTGRFDFVLDE
jgi:putative DNA methylase